MVTKLISQGANGCIYKPAIQCDNEPLDKYANRDKYASKVQMSQHAEHEIKIGEHIMNIPHYQLYFSPIISYCPVDLAEIKDDIINCKPLSKAISKDLNREYKYVSSKIKYVGELDLYDILNKIPNRLIEIHIDLLHSIEVLWQNKIVHFDLKSNNIIYDEAVKCPIIIDFGLSYLDYKIPLFKYDSIISMPQYCIDVCLLLFISEKVLSQPIILSEIEGICDEYANNMIFEVIPSAQYILDLKAYFAGITGTWQTVIDILRVNQVYWDNYALSVTFLMYVAKNETAYKTLLEKVVYAMPSSRLSIQDVRSELLNIMG